MSHRKPLQPIPKSAKKVFDGIIFDVYQWRQKLYDGSFATFEKIKRLNTVEAICTVGDKIILLENNQPGRDSVLSLPGGRMDEEGESQEDSVKREIREETGYKAEKVRLWFKYYPVSKIDWTVYIFIANDVIKVGEQNLDAGEYIKLKLVDFEEFLMLSENPYFNDREMVEEMFMARLYPEKRRKLKKTIWGS